MQIKQGKEGLYGTGKIYKNLYNTGVFCLVLYPDTDGCAVLPDGVAGRRGMARRHSTALKAFLSRGLMAVSLAGILALTLCGREWGSRMGGRFQFFPFWSYWRTITQGDEGLGIQIVNNILLFIPFGFALPLNFPRFKKLRYIILAGALLSLTVELVQGFTGLGLCEIDDVMGNTLGAGIGGWLWFYCTKSNKNPRRQRGNF